MNSSSFTHEERRNHMVWLKAHQLPSAQTVENLVDIFASVFLHVGPSFPPRDVCTVFVLCPSCVRNFINSLRAPSESSGQDPAVLWHGPVGTEECSHMQGSLDVWKQLESKRVSVCIYVKVCCSCGFDGIGVCVCFFLSFGRGGCCSSIVRVWAFWFRYRGIRKQRILCPHTAVNAMFAGQLANISAFCASVWVRLWESVWVCVSADSKLLFPWLCVID